MKRNKPVIIMLLLQVLGVMPLIYYFSALMGFVAVLIGYEIEGTRYDTLPVKIISLIVVAYPVMLVGSYVFSWKKHKRGCEKEAIISSLAPLLFFGVIVALFIIAVALEWL